MSNLCSFPLGTKNEMLHFVQHDIKGGVSGAWKESSYHIIGISRSPLRGSLEMTGSCPISFLGQFKTHSISSRIACSIAPVFNQSWTTVTIPS